MKATKEEAYKIEKCELLKAHLAHATVFQWIRIQVFETLPSKEKKNK